MDFTPNSTAGRVLASASVLVLAGCGMVMNATFGWSLGTTDLSRGVFLAMSIAFDVAKILCLPLAIIHFGKKAWLNGFAALVIWVLATSYGMFSAYGFATSERSHIYASAKAENDAIEARKAKIAELEADIKKAKLAKNDRGGLIFENTGSCLAATKADSMAFCHAYLVKVAELNELVKANSLKQVRDPDPQITNLVRWTGMTRDQVGDWIAMALAVVMETVTCMAGLAFSKTRAPNGSSAKALAKAEQRRLAAERRERRRQNRQKPALSIVR